MKFAQNKDKNSSATHKVFLRAMERCSTTQMTASSVIVAKWMNLVWNLVQQKQAVPHVEWQLISPKQYVLVVVFTDIVAVVASWVTSMD